MNDKHNNMDTLLEKNQQSSTQEYLTLLMSEAAKANCDDTTEDFVNHTSVPPYYDEELFKKGQKFFKKYFFSFFVAKCLGLMAVLAVPSVLKILMFTKMSGDDLTAYRRYVQTIFHMMIWYNSDFKPGSKLWRSITDVRNRHNSASNRSCSAGNHRITQKDMVLTQFGFMGISLCRSKQLGIYNTRDEEWEGFVHLWRVIGYLMGIEERFNICNGTVEQTRERCNRLLVQVFRPYIEQKDENFLDMARHMINGMWSFNLTIQFETLVYVLHSLSQDNGNNNRQLESTPYQLKPEQESNLNFYLGAMRLLKKNWFRIILNYLQELTLWLTKVFPIIPIYQFGYSKARVRILVNNKSD